MCTLPILICMLIIFLYHISCLIHQFGIRIPSNLVDVVLQCAMKQADEAAWNKMFTKYIKSQNPTEKQEYLSLLSAIRDRKLLYQ